MKIKFYHNERPDDFIFTILPTVCFEREEHFAYIDYYVIIPWLVFAIEIKWTKNKRQYASRKPNRDRWRTDGRLPDLPSRHQNITTSEQGLNRKDYINK